MVFEPTGTREFEVRRIGAVRGTQNQFIECETSIGTVAFWSGAVSSANVRAIGGRTPPFRVRCGCRPPSARFADQHTLWVPEIAQVEFLQDDDLPTYTRVDDPIAPAGGAVIAGTSLAVLYVVNCTKAKIWDDDPLAPSYVPAQTAYRGRTVREWLTSEECRHAARWLFLSARYGFIEPDHPIGVYNVTFSEPASGPISDESLRAQVHGQHRWHDRVPLRDFRTVYVWSESAMYEHKAGVAFKPVGAHIVPLQGLTALR
jgi:hypothetical protein